MNPVNKITIQYQDSSGNITERQISDLKPESPTTIDAFCHLRQERRSFNLQRIVHAVNPDTGEILNPWKFIELPSGESARESLESITWLVMPAIKALKFFTLTTRGTRKREVSRLSEFVRQIVDVSTYSDDELTAWVKQLSCWDMTHAWRDGDVEEYTKLLRRIPQAILSTCHACALKIAAGSGRKPIDPTWAERIKSEFCSEPRVKPPTPAGTEGGLLQATAHLPTPQ